MPCWNCLTFGKTGLRFSDVGKEEPLKCLEKGSDRILGAFKKVHLTSMETGLKALPG